MLTVVMDLLFGVAVFMMGYGLLALFDRQAACDEAERLVLALPVGIAGLGAVLYTFNVCGIPFARPLVDLTLGCGVALGAGFAASRREQIRWILRMYRERPLRLDLVGGLALFVAVYISLGYLSLAYLYVDRLTDTLVQHFPFPAIIFRTHHQPAFATVGGADTFSIPPAAFEAYAALWTFTGKIDQLAPNLLPGLYLVCWVALTFLAMRRIFRGSDSSAALAVLLFVAIWEYGTVMGGENVDMPTLLLGGGAAYFAARDASEGGWRRVGPLILMLALYGWTKLHGAPFAFCLACAVILVRGIKDRRVWLMAAGIFAAMMLLMAPFFIHNALAFGNPIYPVACKYLGGYDVTPWALKAVVSRWQPGHPFYDFPKMLTLVLRDAPVVFGIPALILVWRRRETGPVFLGATAIIFFFAFFAVMANHSTYPLRFAIPSLGILSWLGGSLVDRIKESEAVVARTLAAWCLVSGILFWICLMVRVSRMHGISGSLLASQCSVRVLIYIWWIVPFGLLAFPLAALISRRKASVLPIAFIVSMVGVVGLIYHQPFKRMSEDYHIGVLRHPNWDRSPGPTATFRWMQSHLDQHSVFYSHSEDRWVFPGPLVGYDDPLMERIHQSGVPMTTVIETLRSMGVNYIFSWRFYEWAEEDRVYATDPIFKNLLDTRYFQPVCRDPFSSLFRVVYPPGETAARPGPGHPMPWLMDYAASGPMGQKTKDEG